jgi:hypothetical protein
LVLVIAESEQLIVNSNIDVIAIWQVSYEDAILIELRYEGLNFYGVSLYFPSDCEIKRGIETVEDINTAYEGKGNNTLY